MFFRNNGDAKPLFYFVFKLLLRPLDLSHRVERHKLMVNSKEEMSVCVWKGGFMASLLLRCTFVPNVVCETLQLIYIYIYISPTVRQGTPTATGRVVADHTFRSVLRHRYTQFLRM